MPRTLAGTENVLLCRRQVVKVIRYVQSKSVVSGVWPMDLRVCLLFYFDARYQREDWEADVILEECIFIDLHLVTSDMGIGHVGTGLNIQKGLWV